MTTTPVTPAKSKRPKVIILAAVLMLLAAALSFATPFLPRGGGLGGPGVPGGTPPANGQALGAGRPASGQNFTPGQSGLPGLNGTRAGGAFGVTSFVQPVRIGEAVLVGLLALLAALGLWRLRKWGRNLTLVVAGAAVLSAAATFLSPLLGRGLPWLMLVTSATWQAIAGLSLALLAAILALLPAARRAYVVMPKERRVM